MFTAIALIAFSSVSMGNTIADEEVVNENIQKNEDEELVKKADDCLAGKFNCFVDARSAGFSVQDASALSRNFYFWCMKTALD